MERLIKQDNLTLCAESFGKPGNTAIVLVMGSTSSLIWWEVPFCQLLAEKGFFVIRYDNRDTGKSSFYTPGQPGYSLEDMADDTVRVMNAYSIEKAILMGMSLGGAIVQLAAVLHPERVLGLVLLAAQHYGPGAEKLPGAAKELLELFAAASNEPAPQTLDEIVDFAISQWKIIIGGSERAHDEEHVRMMNRQDAQRADNFASRLNHGLVRAKSDAFSRVDEIKQPVLVVHGTHDNVLPYEHGLALAEFYGAPLLTMQGAGHELNNADFAPVADAIVKRFL